MNRTAAAKIGGMDRQTLRDWVHRFNERGPDGLKDNWRRDVPSRLSAAQLARLSTLVETGPDKSVHGVVRWRRVDLKRVIAAEFGVDYHERSVGRLLEQRVARNFFSDRIGSYKRRFISDIRQFCEGVKISVVHFFTL
ncbi:MAG: helix-turn-helix domain-containing protein [Methylobacterium sp.]|nr:helix-turn-helix domain-containing protein [Methylobacterium sp.]MCA3774924.1 helix-turn-helix domain-containing protein [Cutibacterium sp.]MCA3660850.1 helix-turn-helix domain-containing protein [Methylobacterium sp.]MCA3671571.1 helix-turn-helix domain-containing protein [Methylobacterium sp.]MCA3678661.1 helix-turn-helix domain-containing protein [Methylobacterium sp.]